MIGILFIRSLPPGHNIYNPIKQDIIKGMDIHIAYRSQFRKSLLGFIGIIIAI